MELEYYHYIIAIIGSALAGCINTLAGSGSVITLTILTEMLGLPGTIANATNRVGAMTASAASSYAFYKNGKLNLKRGRLYIWLTFIGAVIGAIIVSQLEDKEFMKVFRYLMVVMLFVVLVKPKRWLRETDLTAKLPLWVAVPLFLGIGFYGGFIQMGMGVVFLALMVLVAKYNLIEANSIKVFVVALYTIVVLAIFQYKGLIDWKLGAFMAIGQTVGGYLTANYAAQNEKANLWAYRLLIVMIIVAILKLFGAFDWMMS